MKEIECHSPCHSYAVRDERLGVYVCHTCGRIGDESCVGETSSGEGGLFSGGQEDEYIRFAGEVTLFASSYHIGPWIVVKSPYEAKEAIKSLNEETTGRMWHSDMNCWLIKKDAKETAKERLNNTQFNVIDFTNNDK
jgi:hypothetical protein